MATQRLWLLYLTFTTPDEYTLFRQEPAAEGIDAVFRLTVSGPAPPDLPAGPVGYADFLQWQVALIERGYTVRPLVRVSPRTATL